MSSQDFRSVPRGGKLSTYMLGALRPNASNLLLPFMAKATVSIILSPKYKASVPGHIEHLCTFRVVLGLTKLSPLI